MQVLSWASHRPGLVTTNRVVWREVRNADLTPDLDVPAWLADELAKEGLADAVAFVTSRNIQRNHRTSIAIGDASVDCLVTLGLGNAERVGRRVSEQAKVAGTINILAVVEPGLSETAMIEAISIATEARTLALVEAERVLPTGIATGTGTDCIAIASPHGETLYAGKHTDVGEALGKAVYDAVSRATKEWIEERG